MKYFSILVVFFLFTSNEIAFAQNGRVDKKFSKSFKGITFVLDASGSMRNMWKKGRGNTGSKVYEFIKLVIAGLEKEKIKYSLGLVLISGDCKSGAKVILSPSKENLGNKDSFLKIVKNIRVGGETPLLNGVQLAHQEALKFSKTYPGNCLFVHYVSDGWGSCSDTGEDGIKLLDGLENLSLACQDKTYAYFLQGTFYNERELQSYEEFFRRQDISVQSSEKSDVSRLADEILRNMGVGKKVSGKKVIKSKRETQNSKNQKKESPAKKEAKRPKKKPKKAVLKKEKEKIQ